MRVVLFGSPGDATTVTLETTLYNETPLSPEDVGVLQLLLPDLAPPVRFEPTTL
jgi:hypothetical protein